MIQPYVNDRAQETTIQDDGDVEISFYDAVFMMTDLAGHLTLTKEQREELLRLANHIIISHCESVIDATCQSCIGEFDENKCPRCRVYKDAQILKNCDPSGMFLKEFLS